MNGRLSSWYAGVPAVLLLVGAALPEARAEALVLANGALIAGAVTKTDDGYEVAFPDGSVRYPAAQVREVLSTLPPGARPEEDSRLDVATGLLFVKPAGWAWLEPPEPGVRFALSERRSSADVALFIERDPDPTLAPTAENQKLWSKALREELLPQWTSPTEKPMEFSDLLGGPSLTSVWTVQHQHTKQKFAVAYVCFKREGALLYLRARAAEAAPERVLAALEQVRPYLGAVQPAASDWLTLRAPAFGYGLAYPADWLADHLDQERSSDAAVYPDGQAVRAVVHARVQTPLPTLLTLGTDRVRELGGGPTNPNRFEKRTSGPTRFADVPAYKLEYRIERRGVPLEITEYWLTTGTLVMSFAFEARPEADHELVRRLGMLQASVRLLSDLTDPAVSRRHREARDRLREAAQLLAQRKAAEAAPLLDQLLADYPDYLDAAIQRGECARLAKDTAAAERVLKRALRVQSDHPVLQRQYVDLLKGQGDDAARAKDFEGAVRAYEQIARALPENDETLRANIVRGYAGHLRAYMAVDTAKAERAARSAADLYRDDAELLKVLADIYARQGADAEREKNVSKAKSLYKKALRAYPDHRPAQQALDRLEKQK